jgi:hypothetical protein
MGGDSPPIKAMNNPLTYDNSVVSKLKSCDWFCTFWNHLPSIS